MLITRIMAACAGFAVLVYLGRALRDVYAAHPFASVAVGAVVIFTALAVVARELDRRDDGRRIELRRASQEYGPRPVSEPESMVHHVVHHVVTHEHRHVGEATVRERAGENYALPGGPVVEGEVVREQRD